MLHIRTPDGSQPDLHTVPIQWSSLHCSSEVCLHTSEVGLFPIARLYHKQHRTSWRPFNEQNALDLGKQQSVQSVKEGAECAEFQP